MKIKSFILLLAALVVMSCTGKQAGSQQDEQAKQPDLPPIGTITAYYAATDLEGPYGALKTGDFIADKSDVFAPKIEENGDEFVFTWEPEYDDEEAVIRKYPKSSVTIKTFKPAWLPVADVEKGATFEAKNGDSLRIFRSNSNGHTYPEPDADRFTPEQLKNCLVMMASYFNEEEKITYYRYYQLPEKDGFVSLYEEKDGRLSPFVTADCCPPYEWYLEKGAAYDAQGNLLVDMEIAEMPLPEVVAWIIDEGAIYYNGVLYYRK